MKINKTNKFLNKSSLNVSLIKLKILLNLLFELYIINGKVYFIGFPDFTLSKFSSLFYKFNIINFKSGIWVNGLLSNSIYMKKFFSYNRLKLKKKNLIFIKKFKDILDNRKLPDLIILYETNSETVTILKECQKIKIPIVIIFSNQFLSDNNNHYTIFNSNSFLKKELFINFFFKLLNSVLKKKVLYNKNKKNVKKKAKI